MTQPYPRRPSRASSSGGCLPGVLLLLSIVPLSIVHGATLMKLWQWFVTPFGVQPIGLAHAIGLTAIATALTVAPDRDGEKDGDLWDALVRVWVFRLVVSAMLLLEGWALSGWVR